MITLFDYSNSSSSLSLILRKASKQRPQTTEYNAQSTPSSSGEIKLNVLGEILQLKNLLLQVTANQEKFQQDVESLRLEVDSISNDIKFLKKQKRHENRSEFKLLKEQAKEQAEREQKLAKELAETQSTSSSKESKKKKKHKRKEQAEVQSTSSSKESKKKKKESLEEVQTEDTEPKHKKHKRKKERKAESLEEVQTEDNESNEASDTNNLESIDEETIDNSVEIIEPTTRKGKRRKDIKRPLEESELNPLTKEVRKQEKKKRKAIKERESIEISSEPTYLTLVNPGHPSTEPDIFLNEELSRVIKPHQIEGVRFLWENIIWMKKLEGCILADSMGLGKTLQVIAFLYVWFSAKMGKTALIISPATVIANWEQEFYKWLSPSSRPNVWSLHGKNYPTMDSRLKCLEEWHTQGGVLITGYEIFRTLLNSFESAQFIQYLVDPGPELVVVDEGHRISNPSSNISECLKKLRTTKRIVLTGYPLQNNLSEYWCMVDFARPHYLGTLPEFRNNFENPINNGLCADSRPSDVRLARKRMYLLTKLLKPFVKRRDVSYLMQSLPPKHEFVLSVVLSPLQITLYKAFLAHRVNTLGADVGGGSMLAGQAVLLKLCNHPDILKLAKQKREQRKALSKSQQNVAHLEEHPTSANEVGVESEEVEPEEDNEFFDFSWIGNLLDSPHYEEGRLENSPKMFLLMQMIIECKRIKDKLLVFSQSVQTLDCIQKFLHQYNESAEELMRLRFFRMDGSTPFQERQRQITQFNAPDSKEDVFLLSTRAGGYGINLIAANRVIVFDASWNPGHDVESIYRVFRFGQTREVYIYRFIAAGTIETKIYDRQVIKQGLTKNVVDNRPTRRTIMKTYGEDLFKFVPATGFKSEDERDLALSITEGAADDKLLVSVIKQNSEYVAALHQHESLLVDDDTENLPEEDQRMMDEELRVGGFKRTLDALKNVAKFNSQFGTQSAAAPVQRALGRLDSLKRSRTDVRTEFSKQSSSPSRHQRVEIDLTTSLEEVEYLQAKIASKMASAAQNVPHVPSPKLEVAPNINALTTTAPTPSYASPSQSPVLTSTTTTTTHDSVIQDSEEKFTSEEGSPLLRKHNKLPCRFFHLSGKCGYQDRCKFSHDPISEEEQRILAQKYPEHKLPCKYFHLHNACMWGDQCKYSHEPLTEDGKIFIQNIASTVGALPTIY